MQLYSDKNEGLIFQRFCLANFWYNLL